MAVTRSISTRLVLEGEKAYREGIKQINQEYRTLQSEMKLVDSVYAAQKHSVEALLAKNKVLSETIAKLTEKLNAEKAAIEKMQGLQRAYGEAAEASRQKLAKLTAETDEATRGTKKYENAVNAAQKELTKYEQKEKDAADKVAQHTQKLNGAQAELNKYNGKLNENEKHMTLVREASEHSAKSIDEFGKETKEAGDSAQQMGEKSRESIDALAAALVAAGIVATVREVGKALKECVQASIEFESSFAGVKKTVDASEAEYARLNSSLREMATEIPQTAGGLAEIMEMAGQLGVRGSDNLEKFTATIAAMEVSTNLSREAAATLLAQFANITGMDISNIDRLASTIVELGNNFATTESDIVNMAQGFASAFTQMGMSEAQIMAFSTGLLSMGINAEAGSTAFSKLGLQMKVAAETGEQGNAVIEKTGMSLRQLQMFADKDSGGFKELAHSMGLTTQELKNYMTAAGDLDKFASASSTGAKEFADAFRDDAGAAIMSFLEGLQRIEAEGGSMIVVLEEMGLTEARLGNAIRSAAGGYDVFANAQDMANAAFEENIALQKEAQTRYQTTESRIVLFQNAVSNLKIAIGDELTPAINGWVDTGSDVAKWAADVVEKHPEVVHLTTAVIAAGGAFVGLASGIALVSKAAGALTGLLAGNPAMLAVAAIGAVTAAFVTLAVTTRETDADLEALKKTAESVAGKVQAATSGYESDTGGIDAAVVAAESYIQRLAELERQSSLTDAEQREYERTLEKLKTVIPGINLELDEQTGLLKDGAEALKLQLGTWKEVQYAEAVLERRKELVDAVVEAEVALYEAEGKHKDAQNEAAEWMAVRNEKLIEMGQLMGMNAEQLRMLAENDLWDMVMGSHELRVEVPAENAASIEALAMYLYNVQGSLDGATDRAVSYEAILSSLTGTIGETQTAVESFDTGVQGAAGGTEQMTAATREYAQASKEFVENAKSVSDQIDDLMEQYDASYASAYENITNTLGLFNDMSNQTRTSVHEMIKSLDSQIKFMDDYQKNLTRAAELGIDKGLLEKLSDGSVESAMYLAAIEQDGGRNIAELNAKFAQVEEGKKSFSTQIADMKALFSGNMEEMEAAYAAMVDELDQSGIAYTNAEATMGGVLAGLQSKKGAVDALIQQVQSGLASLGSGEVYGPPAPAGSHAAGLSYVPYDDYMANLHEGEMVLTRLQAQAYRAEQFVNYGMQDKLMQGMGRYEPDPTGMRTGAQSGQPVVMRGGDFYMTQQIIAQETNYAAQQREAARSFGMVAREVMR